MGLASSVAFFAAPQPPPVVPERPARAPSSLPHQPYFFGREKELAILADAISPESRTWGVLIDGPGGIGKTALAVRAGLLAPEKDFDRKVFLTAKVRELTPGGERRLEETTPRRSAITGKPFASPPRSTTGKASPSIQATSPTLPWTGKTGRRPRSSPAKPSSWPRVLGGWR
jgi:hypothetical protein